MERSVLLCGLMMVGLCANAQTDTITGRVHRLDEVTVTESQQRRTVTSAVPLHQLSRADMLHMGVTDVADALHRMPGITLRDYGGAGGMKTASVRGFGAKHTGVSYDGVMLSECQSGEIDLSRYSLDNVERLSLLIGDGTDIFIPARQASTPATITIQTLPTIVQTGARKPHLTTQVKVGSFGYISPFVRYEQPLSPHFSLSVAGEYTYAENDYPFDLRNVNIVTRERRTNSRMNSGHGELNFVWEPTSVSRLTGKLYYYDNDRQLPGIVHYYTNLSGETLHDRNAFGQLLFQTRLGSQLSLKLNGKMNWSESVYRDLLMPGGVNDASYWQREYYVSAALLYTPHSNWAFDYSADYALNNLNGSSWRAVVGRPYRHTILQSATAKYQDRRLTIIGRLLHSLYLNEQCIDVAPERIDIQQNSAGNMRRLSPSLSIAYKLLAAHDLYVRASYKNIFRSPTFNESYYYHYGSTNLKPESTNQLNLGMTYATPSAAALQLQLTLDGYINDTRDMIVAVPQNMFVWTCVNVGKVRSQGLDATLRAAYRMGKAHLLTLTGNYSYQRVENRTNPESSYYGNQIAYMPKHTGSGSIGYENPWVNLSLHATGMSSRWPNNEHYEGSMIDGYWELGATAYRQFHWGRQQMEVRFDLKNLTDKQYEIVAHYPMPGISYQLSILYKF